MPAAPERELTLDDYLHILDVDETHVEEWAGLLMPVPDPLWETVLARYGRKGDDPFHAQGMLFYRATTGLPTRRTTND